MCSCVVSRKHLSGRASLISRLPSHRRVLQMLHCGLGEVQAAYCPLLHSTLEAAAQTVDLTEKTLKQVGQQAERTIRSVRSFSTLTGRVRTADPDLADFLQPLFVQDAAQTLASTQPVLPFDLLPEALCGCLLSAELWTAAAYVPELEVFTGNEHVGYGGNAHEDKEMYSVGYIPMVLRLV